MIVTYYSRKQTIPLMVLFLLAQNKQAYKTPMILEMDFSKYKMKLVNFVP